MGNRVATMANAFSRHDEFDFAWRVNKHCPLTHKQVFPSGIEGIRFVDTAPGFATRWAKNQPGCAWDASADRVKANAAYARIIEAMAGDAYSDGHAAVMARFIRFPDVDEKELAESAAKLNAPVFVFTDSRRKAIADHLAKLGVDSIMPKCAELIEDLSRDTLNTLLFLSDWKTAIASTHIITHPEDSSLIYPMRSQLLTIPPRVGTNPCPS